MKKVSISVASVSLVLLLNGCASPSLTITETGSKVTITPSAVSSPEASKSPVKPLATPEPTTISKEERTGVIWADYSTGLQSEIDQMTKAEDCTGLNSFFGMVTATEEAVKANTGHGNEALSNYLIEALSIAKCGKTELNN